MVVQKLLRVILVGYGVCDSAIISMNGQLIRDALYSGAIQHRNAGRSSNTEADESSQDIAIHDK